MDQLGIWDSQKIMERSIEAAFHHLQQAEARIDQHFGAGFARSHPELIGSYMQTAAAEFAGSLVAQKILLLTERLRLLERKLE